MNNPMPDFWRQKALRRLNKMLKPGGRLFLADVVSRARVDEAQGNIDLQSM